MADRQFGSAWRLMIDLREEGLSGRVTLYNPLDEVSGQGNFIEVGDNRYQVTLEPLQDSLIEGVWVASWEYEGNITTQEFTVAGANDFPSLFDLRLQVAQRVAPVHVGTVQHATADTLTDPTVIGSADDHLGKWLIPDAKCSNTRMVRRVVGYNGSVLTLSEPYPEDLVPGMRYHLFDERLQPELVDQAIKTTLDSVESATYVRVVARDLPHDEGIVRIPRGWDRVSRVVYTDTEEVEREFPASRWQMMTGRRLRILGATPEQRITLTGTRRARFPVWDDSHIDLPPMILLFGASHQLHSSLAGGTAVDFDSHLQRGNADFQQFGSILSRLPRMPLNSVRVIE